FHVTGVQTCALPILQYDLGPLTTVSPRSYCRLRETNSNQLTIAARPPKTDPSILPRNHPHPAASRTATTPRAVYPTQRSTPGGKVRAVNAKPTALPTRYGRSRTTTVAPSRYASDTTGWVRATRSCSLSRCRDCAVAAHAAAPAPTEPRKTAAGTWAAAPVSGHTPIQ